VLRPHGDRKAALVVVRDAALLFWAADELVRGVNPFRRALGLVVGTLTVVGIATS